MLRDAARRPRHVPPVKEDEIENHDMHSEFCIVPDETARIINETKAAGRPRRVRRHDLLPHGGELCEAGRHDGAHERLDEHLYLPGLQFKCMDAPITNFHLPESTLVMLVTAFSTRENILNAYAEAVRENYRFFSFGDAMFIS